MAMKLSNPFPQWLLITMKSFWYCWNCGENGEESGGLDVHHILGRCSKSKLNASVLCKKCHAKGERDTEFQKTLVNKSIIFWWRQGVAWIKEDEDFLKSHPQLLKNNDIVNYEL